MYKGYSFLFLFFATQNKPYFFHKILIKFLNAIKISHTTESLRARPGFLEIYNVFHVFTLHFSIIFFIICYFYRLLICFCNFNFDYVKHSLKLMKLNVKLLQRRFLREKDIINRQLRNFTFHI